MTTQSPVTTAFFAFVLVFVTLSVLVGVLFVLRILSRFASIRALIPANPDHPRHSEVAPEILVVLAAAAQEALGYPVFMHRVHVHKDRHAGESWSRSGRMDVMVSHRMDKKR